MSVSKLGFYLFNYSVCLSNILVKVICDHQLVPLFMFMTSFNAFLSAGARSKECKIDHPSRACCLADCLSYSVIL